MEQDQTTEGAAGSRIIANVEASLARIDSFNRRAVKQPLPSEPKPRRRDIGGPFAWDVVH